MNLRGRSVGSSGINVPGFRDGKSKILETTKWFYIWWYSYPTEKYDFVIWDDEIPNIWKIKKMFQTTNQICSYSLLIRIITDDDICFLSWLIAWPRASRMSHRALVFMI